MLYYIFPCLNEKIETKVTFLQPLHRFGLWHGDDWTVCAKSWGNSKHRFVTLTPILGLEPRRKNECHGRTVEGKDVPSKGFKAEMYSSWCHPLSKFGQCMPMHFADLHDFLCIARSLGGLGTANCLAPDTMQGEHWNPLIEELEEQWRTSIQQTVCLHTSPRRSFVICASVKTSRFEVICSLHTPWGLGCGGELYGWWEQDHLRWIQSWRDAKSKCPSLLDGADCRVPRTED